MDGLTENITDGYERSGEQSGR